MPRAGKTIRQRLKSLESHLRKENPVLVSVVQGYRHLDDVGRSIGILDSEESFATQISWWPMISVLGTFSAGKSTFINHYLDDALQSTGNQAVDDKFTVICFGTEQHAQALPGSALDADPRFPFYRISSELDKVASGEGRRVDTYLQLKTSSSEKLRGRILIDSPGFDADSQRNSTLRLTDHIIDLSDLVLVFFDARHPEPGAMRDTLKHLVGETIFRSDATKFLFVLNQMDTTARDDNPEEVVGAWQRALAQEGLTTGHFFCIYNPDVAVDIADESLRERYESKRDHDLDELNAHIQGVDVVRAYRITAALEKLAYHIEDRLIPRLADYRKRWRQRVMLWDAGLLIVLIGALALMSASSGISVAGVGAWLSSLQGSTAQLVVVGVLLFILLGLFAWVHYRIRRMVASGILKSIDRNYVPGLERSRLRNGFIFNTRPWVSLFRAVPVGWSKRVRKRLHRVVNEASGYIQVLNDRFTDPSGAPADRRVSAQVANLSVVRPTAETGRDAPATPDRTAG